MNRRKFLLAGLLAPLAPLGLKLAKLFPAKPEPLQEVIALLRQDLHGLIGKSMSSARIAQTLEGTLKQLERRQLIASGKVLGVSRYKDEMNTAEATVIVRPNQALSYVNVSFIVKSA